MDDAEKAAQLAAEVQSMMNGPTVLVHLAEFALACVVEGHATRACLEEHLGEPLPDHLWLEAEQLANAEEKVSLSEADDSSIRLLVGIAALGCVARGEGGRCSLESRLDRPLDDEAWEGLAQAIPGVTAGLRAKWRQMRDSKMVSFPDSLFGTR